MITLVTLVQLYIQLMEYSRSLTDLRKRARKRRARRLRLYIRRRHFRLTSFMAMIESLPDGRAGRIWKYPTSSDLWDNYMNNWSDRKWLENFRMGKRTFEFICDRLRIYLQKQPTRIRQPICVRKRVAITLWKLATNIEYRTLAHLFGIGRSTVGKIVLETSKVIAEKLSCDYVKFPEGNDMINNIQRFEGRWGFPQCYGAIDGTHIPIVAPDTHSKDYYNRKGWMSINVQAVVSSSYHFIDATIGWPGSVHDARVLAQSALYIQAGDNRLLPDNRRDINNVSVPLVLLGDAAYPLLTWLMTPFRDTGNLSAEQKAYNYRHSRARMVVENAFGRLKGRWRILLKRVDCRLDSIPNIVLVCMTLHNICEDFGEAYDAQHDEEIEFNHHNQPRDIFRNRNNQPGPIAIRNALKTYLS